jgi:hypothetical protein
MMTCGGSPLLIDHFLVTKVQSRATGENAHNLHALLGNYFGLCAEAGDDPDLRIRCADIERRLRVFCQTGRLPGNN